MPSILELAQHAVAAAMKAGADFADAYCGVVRHADVAMDNSSVLDCHVIRDYGIGVRAFHHGGMGSSTVQSLEPDEVARCGEEAATIAKIAHPDPDFVSLPDPSEAPEIDGLFDEQVAGLPAEAVVQWCKEAIAEALDVSPEARVSGGAGFSVGEGAIASSTGIALTRPGTQVEISVEATIQRGDEVGFYFDYDIARRMADFAPVGVGAKACREALRFLGARPVETLRTSLVLGPLAVAEMLGAVIGAASADHIQRSRSFLIGKEGARIASDCLTIREVPFWPAGISSTSHDGEGVAKQELTLLDRGVLTTYLHNSYTAHKAGVPNNAHATRGGYGGAVGIGVANLQITPGARPEADLIADLQDGLYISFAALTPNPTSGEVSATIDFGFRIIGGEIAYPVKTAMVGSDAFTLLGAIDAVSSDYREEPGMIVPSLRLHGIQVAGSGNA
jgi:PmbA protein